MYCSLVRITAALEAPNQDAIKSTDARPGTPNNGFTTGLAITPKNSMIPQSVKNGSIKLKLITIQISVQHKSVIVAPVSIDVINSGPNPSTTMQQTTAPITFDTK